MNRFLVFSHLPAVERLRYAAATASVFASVYRATGRYCPRIRLLLGVSPATVFAT